MQGSLLIAFGFLSPWKRHFCVLKDQEFQFTQQCSNPRTGSVTMKKAEVIVPIDSTTKFQIKSQGLTIEAKADDAQTRIKWVRALTFVPEKNNIPTGLIDQIYQIRNDINSVIWQMIKRCDSTVAEKLKSLSEILSQKINKLISFNRNGTEANDKDGSGSDLSFHSVLDPEELQYKFIEQNQLQLPNLELSQSNSIFSYEGIKQRILKQNPVFMKVFSSFTKQANRIQLPTPSNQKSMDLMNILKGVIGIDTLNMSLPITAYQPLSTLQKFAEQMMFEELLVEANKYDDSSKRMLHVMAFALSSYSMSRPRLQYKSLLGQTYELKTDRYKFIAEQVSFNHSAFHCESEQYIVEGYIEATTQFTGRSLEIIPKGYTYIYLKNYRQTICYNRCQRSIKNLVFGEATVVNSGEVNFDNHQSESGFLSLKSKSLLFNDTNPNGVQGWVKSHEVLRYLLQGSWSGYLSADDIKLKVKDKVWDWTQEVFSQFYGFSNFTIFLNHLNLNEIGSLPGTDTRFRPDIKAQEYGMIELCEQERNRLERKEKERSKIFSPVWFEPSIHPLTNTPYYKFNNKYWKQKNQKKWTSIIDIY